LRETLEEIHALAVRSGIALSADAVERTLAFIDGLPPDGTASMQRDVLAGRPSELETQVGTVVRLGERLAVEVPVHRTIYAALLPQERRARGEPLTAGGSAPRPASTAPPHR
jgi:2-dehydropantoate 2-reductase